MIAFHQSLETFPLFTFWNQIFRVSVFLLHCIADGQTSLWTFTSRSARGESGNLSSSANDFWDSHWREKAMQGSIICFVLYLQFLFLFGCWASCIEWMKKSPVPLEKHRKNCECCPRHSLFKDHNVIANISIREHPQRSILETCDTDYISDNWEQQY